MNRFSIYTAWKYFKEDSLFRNSVYLMISTGIMGITGFIFWILVARLFSPKEVGIATALISACTLLSNLSLFGFNYSLIRYLPISSNKNEKINSAFFLVFSGCIFTSIIFIVGLRLFSPQLLFLQRNIFYALSFILFVIAISLNSLVESIFIAHRASGNVLLKNTFLSALKTFSPLVFVVLGSYGVFTAATLPILLGACLGVGILLYKYAYKPSFSLQKDVIKEMAFFSGGNYVSSFFSQSTSLILPLLIVNILSPEVAAYFYISSMIMNFLLIIPQSTTQSLLAEGSHDIALLRKHFFRSLIIVFVFLLPAILVLSLFGNVILHAFGKNYATEAFTFLRILCINSIFMSICILGNSLLRLKHKIMYLVGLNAWSAVSTLSLVYLFIHRGLIAIGWSMVVSQVILTIIYIILFKKKDIL